MTNTRSISNAPVGEGAPATSPTGGLWQRFRLSAGTGPLLVLPLVFLVVAFGVPMGFVVATAFGPGDTTWIDVLTDPLFTNALSRTLFLAITVCAICTVLGVVFALAMSLSPAWLSAVLMAVLGAMFFVSLMVRTYGWVILFQPKGLLYDFGTAVGIVDGPLEILKSAPAMYVGMVHIMLPFSVLLTYSALTSMNVNLLRAARSMGAGAWLTFWRVILPEIKGGIIAGALFVFMVSLAFYVTPAVLGGPTQLTMGTLIGREMNVKFDFKAAAMLGLLLTVVVLVLYLASERLFKITKQWERQ